MDLPKTAASWNAVDPKTQRAASTRAHHIYTTASAVVIIMLPSCTGTVEIRKARTTESRNTVDPKTQRVDRGCYLWLLAVAEGATCRREAASSELTSPFSGERQRDTADKCIGIATTMLSDPRESRSTPGSPSLLFGP